jgi:hypothetical protein
MRIGFLRRRKHIAAALFVDDNKGVRPPKKKSN